MLQVIGAGNARTGTTSLKLALERLLGGRCHHMIEILKDHSQMPGWTAAIDGESRDWDTLLSGYDAAVDWPSSMFWPELLAANPDALVVLSVRPAEEWFVSLSNTIIPVWDNPPPPLKEFMATLGQLLGERFSFDYHDPAAMMAAFEKHNQSVRAAVPADRLLEWTATDGWEPLCARLGLAVPDEPFPKANTTAEFSQNLKW